MADSIAAYIARTLNFVDSTKIANGSVSGADLRVDAVDSTKIRAGSVSTTDLAGGGSLSLHTLTVDTLIVGSPVRWNTPLPTYFDSTTIAEGDSGTVKPLAVIANPSEYAVALSFTGNGTAPVDTLIMVDTFLPVFDRPDSAYWWAWADTVSASLAGFDVTVKWQGDAAGDTTTVFSSQGNAVASASTWQRFAVPLANDFTNNFHTVWMEVVTGLAHEVRLSRVYFK